MDLSKAAILEPPAVSRTHLLDKRMEQNIMQVLKIVYCLALAAASLPLSQAIAQGASGQIRLLEGGDRSAPANPRVQTWAITQAVAWVGSRGDIEVVLGTGDVDFSSFADALDPRSWLRENLKRDSTRHVSLSISGEPSSIYANAYLGPLVFAPASHGTVYAARTEDGRLRGRLVTIGALRGSIFTDVRLDVPLWLAPVHQPLPSGGGEPGTALRALETAIQTEDAVGVRALLGPELLAEFPNEKAFVAEVIKQKQLFGNGHKVQKGLTSGDMAILISRAHASGRDVPVRTVWKRIDKQWRFTAISFNTTELLDTQATPKPLINVAIEPAVLADAPRIRFGDDTSLVVRHARALALKSGEHLLVLSDQALKTHAEKPDSIAELHCSS